MSELLCRTPATLEELVQCLGACGPDSFLLGGGTDLVIRLRERGIRRGTLIDLGGVAGLDTLEGEGDWIAIGANVTYAELAASPLILGSVPCLAQMASQVGSAQIRNMARLPGNIANASPAGDAIATLMALAAQVRTIDSRGRLRDRSIAQVVTGIGRTTLERDEAILQVRVPRPGPDQRSAYGKLGLGARRQVVIANVSLTMVVQWAADQGRIGSAQVVLGSAAPLAYHADAAEALLAGRRPDRQLGLDLAEALRRHVELSIKGNPLFKHKLSDVQGLALDLFTHLFHTELGA